MGIGTVTGALALAVVGSGTGHGVQEAAEPPMTPPPPFTAADPGAPVAVAAVATAGCLCRCVCVCSTAATMHVPLCKAGGRLLHDAAVAAAAAAAAVTGPVRGAPALALLQEAVRDTAGSLCSRVVAGGGAWHGFVASLQEVCDADGSLLCCMDVGGPWRGIVTSLQEEVLTAAASPDFLTCPQDCLHVLAAYPRPLLLPPVSFAWPQLDTHDTGDCVPHCLLPTLPVLLCGCSCAALLGSGGGASQWDAQDEAQDAADWVVWEPCTRAPEAPPVLPPGCGCPWGSAAAAAAAPVAAAPASTLISLASRLAVAAPAPCANRAAKVTQVLEGAAWLLVHCAAGVLRPAAWQLAPPPPPPPPPPPVPLPPLPPTARALVASAGNPSPAATFINPFSAAPPGSPFPSAAPAPAAAAAAVLDGATGVGCGGSALLRPPARTPGGWWARGVDLLAAPLPAPPALGLAFRAGVGGLGAALAGVGVDTAALESLPGKAAVVECLTGEAAAAAESLRGEATAAGAAESLRGEAAAAAAAARLAALLAVALPGSGALVGVVQVVAVVAMPGDGTLLCEGGPFSAGAEIAAVATALPDGAEIAEAGWALLGFGTGAAEGRLGVPSLAAAAGAAGAGLGLVGMRALPPWLLPLPLPPPPALPKGAVVGTAALAGNAPPLAGAFVAAALALPLLFFVGASALLLVFAAAVGVNPTEGVDLGPALFTLGLLTPAAPVPAGLACWGEAGPCAQPLLLQTRACRKGVQGKELLVMTGQCWLGLAASVHTLQLDCH
eukprot:1139852-Pelagomonas_calceolata.AAC.7